VQEVTPEMVFSEWRRQTFLKEKNFCPKAVRDFAKQKEKPEWAYFERFAKMVNNNAGNIDYKVFIAAQVDFYGGWFNPVNLGSLKSIKLYNNYVSILNATDTVVAIEKGIVASVKTVGVYMRDRDIKTFDEYLFEGKAIIPTMAKQLKAGTVTKFFVSIVPNVVDIIKSYPPDVTATYFHSFLEEVDMLRAKSLTSPKVRQLFDVLPQVVEKIAMTPPENSH